MKKIVQKLCFFVSPPYDFWQFQKSSTKSETRFGFKLLGNHLYKKKKLAQINGVAEDLYLLLYHTSVAEKSTL